MSGWRVAVLFLATSAACWTSSEFGEDRSDVDAHETFDDGGVDRTGDDDAAAPAEDSLADAAGDAEAVADDAATGDVASDDAGDVPSCLPPCPVGSACLDRDGVGAPECIWPSGELACAGDDPISEYCPADSFCVDGICERWCSCVTDENCGVDEVVCVNEDIGCGICALWGPYRCLDSPECRYVVDLLLCCHCPKARNAATVAADPCLVAYPPVGDPPPGCEPDCTGIDHCWPCEPDGGSAECRWGICRAVPAP